MNNTNNADMMPDEIGAVRELVNEFIQKIESVDNEIEQLKQDRKDIIDEYSDRLDMKTLKAALAVVKIRSKVEHKDTFDLFVEALTEI